MPVQVAASAEELTANAQQSADAAVHVAETVGDVSAGMNQQLQDINGAKEHVDVVFRDITAMADKARLVSDTSNQTAEAAQKDAELMEQAVARMGNIENSVIASADVVRKLGENSQQIGQIVEAISSISQQTNLLSLKTVTDGAENIVGAVDNIDTINRKTANSTQTISAATEEQSASNEEIAAASQSLAKMAADMQTAISKFKL